MFTKIDQSTIIVFTFINYFLIPIIHLNLFVGAAEQKRQAITDNYDFLAYKVRLNLLRENNRPLKFTQDFLDPRSPTFLRVADKAEKGLNSIFCRDTVSCNPLYVGSQLTGFEPSANLVQIIITLYWKPPYTGGVLTMTKDLYDSLASNNGFLGNTDLFVGPIESITKSYTYAMPVMRIQGRQVSYTQELEDSTSRAFALIAGPFTDSMDNLFRNSPSFGESYIACNVRDMDPLPIQRTGIMMTYTIFMLQNYTRGPNDISDFIKGSFSGGQENCLPSATICTIPLNTEYEIVHNIVRRGFQKMVCQHDMQNKNPSEFNYLKNTFETGMRQVINASPNVRSSFHSLNVIDMTDATPLGCMFRYKVTMRPSYKGDSQTLESDISGTINDWGKSCLGNTNLCTNRIPGECSIGNHESCGDPRNNQICVLETFGSGKRTVCQCKSGYVKTSPLGPCFLSTCTNPTFNSLTGSIGDPTCSGRPFESCTFNPRTVRMECDCISGYRRYNPPNGPCVRADCDTGSNAGCYENQECAYQVLSGKAVISCRCKRGYIQLTSGGPCVLRTCDTKNNEGCAPGEICRYHPSQNRQPVCDCKEGYYRVTSNQFPTSTVFGNQAGSKSTSSICVQGNCNPIKNTGCPGPNEVCTFSSTSGSDKSSVIQIYCACAFGFIRTHANRPCIRNLCDPRTNAGCKNNQICTLNEVTNQFECKCRNGYAFTYNDNGCSPEVCNVKSQTGCGPNEQCVNDPLAGVRCVCRSGFLKNTQSGNRCIPSQCDPNGSGCGENQRCLFVNDGNNPRFICRCLPGYLGHSSGRCIKTDCDPNSNQGCRQNEICLFSPQRNNGLPYCECKSPQFYKIGDACLSGRCNPIDNTGCRSNQICRVDSNGNPFCTCPKGYISRTEEPSSSKSLVSGELCIPAECNPLSGVTIGPGISPSSQASYSKSGSWIVGPCPQNEVCQYVLNKIGKGGQYKCICQSGFLRVPSDTGICYRSECEPATNKGCNKPEICSLIGDVIKCICPYNYRKLSDHPNAPCVYSTCDPLTNDGCAVNELCKTFPASNEIKCVCSYGFIRDPNDERCIKETTTVIPAEVITYCKSEDKQLINCGPFSECIMINGVPICKCLPGYIKDETGQCISKWSSSTVYTSIETSVITESSPTPTSPTPTITSPTPIIIIPPVILTTPPASCANKNCTANQICRIVTDNGTQTAVCECPPGFTKIDNGTCIDYRVTPVTEAVILPPCDDSYCTYHGQCIIHENDGSRWCKCERWWIGRQCQHNGKLIAILAPLLLGLLLLLCCCLLPLCWFFSRRRKKRIAENINVAQGGYDKMVPYTIPRPMVSPVRTDEQSLIKEGSLCGFPETTALEREDYKSRETLAGAAGGSMSKPLETTEVSEETVTEEWTRKYKPKRRYEHRRSTTPITRKKITQDIEEEESAEFETNEAGGVETDNENGVYVGGRKQFITRGGGTSSIDEPRAIGSSSYQRTNYPPPEDGGTTRIAVEQRESSNRPNPSYQQRQRYTATRTASDFDDRDNYIVNEGGQGRFNKGNDNRYRREEEIGGPNTRYYDDYNLKYERGDHRAHDNRSYER